MSYLWKLKLLKHNARSMSKFHSFLIGWRNQLALFSVLSILPLVAIDLVVFLLVVTFPTFGPSSALWTFLVFLVPLWLGFCWNWNRSSLLVLWNKENQVFSYWLDGLCCVSPSLEYQRLISKDHGGKIVQPAETFSYLWCFFIRTKV
jgi:hypothetical protein